MQKIRIDFDNPGLPQHISAVENDSQSRFFQATLYENGKAYTAPEGAAYSIMYRGFGPQNQGWYDTINDGAGKRAACAVSGNVVTCEIARQALQVPGHVSILLCVTTGKGYMLKSWPIECDCKNDRYDSTTEIESFFYVTSVSNASWMQAIQAVEELKNIIDPTLTLSGKAADAAKVKEAINAESERAKGVESQIKEDIDAIYSSVSEKINVDITIKNGYVNNENGEIVENSNYHYAEISVKADERYVISAYYYAPSKLSLVYFYDSNNALLGSVGAYADGIEESEYVQEYIVNIPADCAKIIVQSWGSKPILVDKLELTDTDNTEPLENGYVPMHFTISNGIWSDGTIVPHASYKAIVFACGGNEHYSIDTYMNGDAKMPVARFLNRAGTEIGTTDIITDTGPLYQYKIVTPKNCAKMIVNGYLQPSNWPYAIRKYIPGHLPLAEKNVVFLGDSIMHGLSNTAYAGGWRDWFCRFTGATQIMCTAVSGATICDYDDTILNGNPLDTEHSNTLSNQVQSIINSPPSNPDFVDYILIFAGTNDHAILSEFQGGVTQFINTATNSYIDIDTVDRTRYDGAMRWVTEKLWGIFPRAKIYWITPIQGAEPIRQTRLQIMKSDYMKEIATWLACPVIDATRNSGIYGRYENANAIGKYLFDGLHPTGEGYKLLGEFIAKEVASRESY